MPGRKQSSVGRLGGRHTPGMIRGGDEGPASADDRPAGRRAGLSRMAAPGQLVRHYRRLAGMTQEELAERSGYTANYIGKLERGQRRLPPEALHHVIEVLGLGDGARAELLAACAQRPDSPSDSGRITGRGAEVAEIRRHLAGLGPPVLLLSGEPGIGKTRLLGEAAAHGAKDGWWVVQGGCQRRAQDPYAPLTDALAGALRHLSAHEREAARADAAGLELLLPEFEALHHQRDFSPARQPDQQRRLLFAAVARCLRVAAGEAGTVLILDDLQWAGPDVFDLLAALVTAAGSSPIRLVAAYRDSETTASSPLSAFVAGLTRDSMVQVIALGPLSESDAEQLLARRIPESDERQRALVPAIVRRSGGVPFFLVSYLEDLCRRDGAEPVLGLPWTVTQVIRQRVVVLPDTVRELLGVAAVVGRTVGHSFLSRVTGRTAEEVLDALEVAADARLLTEDKDGAYSFTHDLIRETIEADLSTGRRRLLHQRVGETLENDERASLESLAFHFALSDDQKRAIRYLELAGDEAQARVAHAAAADFFRQAIERVEQSGEPWNTTLTREKLAMALYALGRYDEAIALLRHSLDKHRAAGDQEEIHRIAGRLADAHFRRGTGNDSLDHVAGLVADHALDRPGGPTHGAIALREGLVRLLFGQASYKRMRTVGRSLGRVGRATGNRRLMRMGKRVEGVALIFLGRLPEGAALLAATIPAVLTVEGDERIAEVMTALSAAYLAMGRLDLCTALSTRMLHVAEAANDAVLIATYTLLGGAAAHTAGDPEHGWDSIRRAQELFAATGPSALSVRMISVLAPCLIQQGEWEEARQYLDTSLPLVRTMGVVHPERAALTYLAEIDLLEGRTHEAVHRLEPLAEKDLAWGYAATLLSTLAEAYLQLGYPDKAHPLAERAVAETRRMECWTRGVEALRVLGTVEVCRGNDARAERVYEEGLQRARAMPFPYGEAQMLHAYGLLEWHRGNDVRAGEYTQQALTLFQRLGAHEDLERVRGTMRAG